MSFFSGNADFRGGRLSRMLITNSAINTTALDMNLRPITSVQNPVNPQDAATRWYVDHALEEFQNTLENPYSGYQVTLSSTEPTTFANLRSGSYVITVNPMRDDFPTAAFVVSKSSIYAEGHITKLTGVSGWYTPEQLEILWPPGTGLQLRKTGPGFDGDYIIDLNMKNTSDLPHPPAIPTDVCDMAYVDRAIRDALNFRFGGQIVTLNETNIATVMNMRCGSYMMAVTPINMDGAPTACFSVSKNSTYGPASITRTSSDSGRSAYAEQLELLWPANSMILLKKTGPGYDGEYLIDMNLKNLSSVPETLLPSDASTRAYVDSQIAAHMQAKFSGELVTLRDTEFTNVVNLQPGSYSINVSNVVNGGPTASFAISKNSPLAEASVTRTSNLTGEQTGEQLELIWPGNRMLALRKTGPFYDGEYLVDFNLKNVSPTAAEHTLPEDHATRNYVDHQIMAAMNMKLEGIKVHLGNDAFAYAAPLKCGSYMITVSSLVHGGATATFAVSKSSNTGVASITRMTSCSASDSGEQLELSWPENSKIMLRKTGPMHDGEYLIDLNLKNFTSAAPDLISTDIATRDFVQDQIQAAMNMKLEGVKIHLENDTFAQAAALGLRCGSYMITVSSLVHGGATATFAVSKASNTEHASITRITSCSAPESGEQLELIWPENSNIMLRKTGAMHDGEYVIDLNMRNFTSAAPDLIPTDIATRDFVQDQIKAVLNTRLEGVKIHLENDEFATATALSLRCGSYMISVTSLVHGGPTATFAVSKAANTETASITRITSCSAPESGEQLELVWPENSKLKLRKNGPMHDGEYLIDLNLKNLSGAPPDVIPTDIATRDFVQEQIQAAMNMKLEGVKVHLRDDAFAQAAELALRCGSYMITVTSLVYGGPTATFAVSKSTNTGTASITRMTSCSADDSGEQLELMWPENGKIMLRKTGPMHDGEYLIDLNLRNFTSAAPDLIPTDIATRDFVQDQIQAALNLKLEGVKVHLENDAFTQAAAHGLRCGSYMITVSSLVHGGATATFAVSKAAITDTPSITRLTSCSATDSGEQLELSWPQNEKIMLRKTGPMHDGEYLIDLNLKNFSAAAPDLISTDLATRDFVQDQIQAALNLKLEGVKVHLENDTFAQAAALALRCGSYMITVSPLVHGGATATFAVSKASNTETASITRLTSCSASQSGEQLELIWPENDKVLLRKTGPMHDGEYLIDLNMKNLTSAAPDLIPTDIATRDFVQDQIHAALNLKLEGVKVHLESDSFAQAAALALRCGSYMITVSSLVHGGATATFAVSKSSHAETASITRMTSCSAADTGEQLELIWPDNSKIMLRKTGPMHNGEYLIDLNMKNFTSAAPDMLPADLATREFVQDIVSDQLKQVKNLSGVHVHLKDTELVPVTELTPGSYLITVSAILPGSPTMTVSVSKSTHEDDASITVISSHPGQNGGQLEVQWLPGSKLCLRKTSTFHEGSYCVNFISNASSIGANHVVTGDVATDTTRTIVQLTGEYVTSFPTPLSGSFTVHVAPINEGPAASFVITKSNPHRGASVNMLTSAPGDPNEDSFIPTKLVLTWPMDCTMCLGKDSKWFDGAYDVKVI